jgi:dihydrofolate reductase
VESLGHGAIRFRHLGDLFVVSENVTLDGAIVGAGGIRLVHTLMENDLVDELRLMIYPVVLGAGERLTPLGVHRPLPSSRWA